MEQGGGTGDKASDFHFFISLQIVPISRDWINDTINPIFSEGLCLV